MIFSVEHGQIFALCPHGERKALTLRAAAQLLAESKRVVLGKVKALEVRCVHGDTFRLEHRECIELLATVRQARKAGRNRGSQ